MEENTNYLQEIDIEDNSNQSDEVIPLRYDVTIYGADYDVESTIRRLQKGRLFIPHFQDNFTWTIIQASRFIESLLLGLPVPGVFLARDYTNKRLLVIDGKQRLLALKSFYEGKFHEHPFKLRGVQEEFEGKAFNDLDESLRDTLLISTLHASIVSQNKAEEQGDYSEAIFILFERLSELSAQEIRACVYYGGFNNCLSKLKEVAAWREVMRSEKKRMKEEELILRFFAFYFGWENYKKGLKKFLNNFMNTYKDLSPEKETEFTSLFTQTITLVFQAKGKDTFQIKENLLNAAVMDAVLVGVAKRLAQGDTPSKEAVASAYDALTQNPEFIGFCTSTTADESAVSGRMTLSIEYFKGC